MQASPRTQPPKAETAQKAEERSASKTSNNSFFGSLLPDCQCFTRSKSGEKEQQVGAVWSHVDAEDDHDGQDGKANADGENNASQAAKTATAEQEQKTKTKQEQRARDSTATVFEFEPEERVQVVEANEAENLPQLQLHSLEHAHSSVVASNELDNKDDADATSASAVAVGVLPEVPASSSAACASI